MRIQYTIRGLLLFVFICSIPLGWFGWSIQRARHRREFLDAITRTTPNSIYCYDFQWPYEYDSEGQVALKEPNEPIWLINLLGVDFFHDVVGLEIGKPLPDASYDLSLLTKLARIEASGVDDRFIRQLSTASSLEKIIISDGKLTSAGLESLKALPRLRCLLFSHCRISQDGYQSIKACRRLEQIGFSFMENEEGDTFVLPTYAVDCLAELSGLRELSFFGAAPPRTNDFRFLAGLKNLNNLKIFAAPVTDAGFSAICDQSEMQFLQVSPSDSNLTEGGVKCLAKMRNLRRLRLEGDEVTDPILEVIGENCNEIEMLWFNSRKITAVGLRSLSRLSHLQQLTLLNIRIGSEERKAIEQLKGVNEIRLSKPESADEAGEHALLRKNGAVRLSY